LASKVPLPENDSFESYLLWVMLLVFPTAFPMLFPRGLLCLKFA
jgi:hypothetical protein